MKKLVPLTFFLLCFSCAAYALPKEILKDKYMMQITTALKEKDYAKAEPLFEKIEELMLPLPTSFHYFKGETYYHTGKYAQSKKSIETYLVTAGKEGKFYTGALNILNQAESILSIIPDSMVFVKGGCFKYSDLNISQELCVDSFQVSAHEVTVGKFSKFVRETGYKTHAEAGTGGCNVKRYRGEGFEFSYHPNSNNNWLNPHPDYKINENHPVTCINNNDIQSYISWLTNKTGIKYRLLSMAEWIYLVSEKGKKRLSSKEAVGNLFQEDDGYIYTSPVGHYENNKINIFDLYGNVQELTCTPFSPKDYSKNRISIDYYLTCNPLRSNSDNEIALGAFNSSIVAYIDVAGSRFSLPSNTIGFRLASDVNQ